MSLKSEIIKATLLIGINFNFPEAVAIQLFSNGVINYAEEIYENISTEKKKKINVQVEKCLREMEVESTNYIYFQTQIENILKCVQLDIETLAKYRNNITGLCHYLIEEYRDGYLDGYMDMEKEITYALVNMLPKIICSMSSNDEEIFNALLQIVEKVKNVEEDISVLKQQLRELSRLEQQEYPVFISNLPFAQCECFLGRESELVSIFEAINLYKSVIMFGLGGIGKTEVAKYIINTVMKQKCIIHGIEKIAWVDYDNIDIEKCISKSFHETRGIKDTNEAWKVAQQLIMNQGQRLLLVIDNLESDLDKNLLRLSNLPCRILLTSRVKELRGFHLIEIGTLAEDECIKLFEYFYSSHIGSNEDVRQIVKLADYLTVVIELLAKIANQERVELSEFLKQLNDLGFYISNEEAASIHEKLQDEDCIIKQIAKLFSIRPIKKDDQILLMSLSVIPSIAFSYENAVRWFRITNHSILNRLVKYGWLIGNDSCSETDKWVERNYYLMHSVIASAIRYQYQGDLYEYCRDFMHILSEEMQYPIDEHGAGKSHLTQYSWAIRELLKDYYIEEKDADFMLYSARIFTDVSNYDQAYLLLRHCVRLYNSDEKTVIKQISCYNQIGICYNNQEKLNCALTQYKKAFQLAQQHHVDLSLWITLYTDAASVYMKKDGCEQGGFADVYLKHAYEYALMVYGEKHVQTRRVISLWNHCLATYAPERAKENFEKIICYAEECYDSMHPQLAETYSSYALFLYNHENNKSALKYFQKAYEIKYTVMGAKHPETIDIVNTIGLIYIYTGNVIEARKQFQICIDATLEREGMISPTMATFINNIALLDFKEEQYEKAYDRFVESEKIYRKCQLIFKNDYVEDIARTLANEAQCLTEVTNLIIKEAVSDPTNATVEGNVQIRKNLFDAIDRLKQAISILSKDKVRYRFQIAQMYGYLATNYEVLACPQEARDSFLFAIEEIIHCKHEFYSSLACLYNNYGLFLDTQEEYSEAFYYLKKAEETLIYNGVDNDEENLEHVRAAIRGIEKKIKL